MEISQNKSNRFANKKILITGAAGGIGKSLVKFFREEGAIVAATDIKLAEINVEACFEGDLMLLMKFLKHPFHSQPQCNTLNQDISKRIFQIYLNDVPLQITVLRLQNL